MPEGGTPETTGYLILALIIVAVLVVALVASMIIRYRNLRRDIEMIEQLEDEKPKR